MNSLTKLNNEGIFLKRVIKIGSQLTKIKKNTQPTIEPSPFLMSFEKGIVCVVYTLIYFSCSIIKNDPITSLIHSGCRWYSET